MDRGAMSKFWNEAWSNGLWAASWQQSVQGLSAEQAAWKPAPQRHSVWQILSHIIYWREVQLRRLQTGQEPAKEEIVQRNFAEPKDANESAWKDTLRKLDETRRRVAEAIADERIDAEKLAVLFPHDCYHFGQINYVRALAGLKPIE